ncbi:Eco57I restriction-modification methylase domain-containing protein [Pseudoalteromonas sp. PAMC 22718]|uniref:Eco57I restriction-modification methylase domain-containing protein n=1 Tax=Pseudoalteromonas sp. PAMC 22718 TaxID=1175295 RepID=UPI0002D62D3C|nr:type IIL restriction-modification enzyme MmeI [Pseudoalteromonas sp. PAMC 22718]
MAYSTNQHAEWLSLIEVSGPFLAEPILNQAFPQGLEKVDPIKKRQFRQTYDEWREVIDSDAQQDIQIKGKIHQQWTSWVLKFGLELNEDEDGDILKDQTQMSSSIQVTVPEHHVTLIPEYAIVASDDANPYMLIQTYPAGTALSEVLRGDGWSTSPAERMAHLCRGVGTRLGLISNGEQWMFIDAPAGGITTYASWFARLWGLEPVTLKAFYSLFNIGTVFNGFDEAKSLPQLIDESLQHQDDVTQTLGTQVSRAVEVLIQSIDRINHDHNGELLEGIKPEELYEAGLTLMMRLVFLLCAEERGLLLLGDQAYEANYALSTLRAKLREEASLHGDEVLSYRKNAWARLLAIFRSVYSGVEHENMRMPALGGSLFDPDRFPFLEGRTKGSNWLEDEAKPLPIDNRTVLLFLDAIQLYQGRTLSYRALDVEQIGYVYEGLLEQTVKRAPDVTLELSGSKSCKKPWVYLSELASASLDGEAVLKKLLKERTGSSPSRITNDLAKEVTDADVDKLMVACYNDVELCQRIKPYYHFLRFDAWGNPLLYPKNAFMLTTGSDRRETGSHYTPKSLTESIVTETLEPVVYIGPAEGKPREEWQLKPPEELLNLKICDPAMGSGAFLVQVCRWLAERVCESWLIAEESGAFITAKGFTTTDESQELIPIDAEERLTEAKKLISERCLYGVDINPLAVELAKLSIWLVTLSKDRPFGFLDHNLKSGDSLLGIHNLDQLSYLNLSPSQTKKSKLVEQPFVKQIKELVADTLELRKKIASHDINLVSDIDEMAQLEQQAKEKILLPKLIADALVGLTLESGGKLRDISVLSSFIQQTIAGDDESLSALNDLAIRGLNADSPEKNKARKAFHWCLEFPEVFHSMNSGFDAVIGNPPYVWGNRISTKFGDKYRKYLYICAPNLQANSDLCSVFLYRTFLLLNTNGVLGEICTNSISETDNRVAAIEPIIKCGGAINWALTNLDWPGKATIKVTLLVISRDKKKFLKVLNSKTVSFISSHLDTSTENWKPIRLLENKKMAFKGVDTGGLGFVLEESDLTNIPEESLCKIQPFLNGKEFLSNVNRSATREIINFSGLSEEEASTYEALLSIVRTRVKPYRDGVKRKANREQWWLYNEARPGLYQKIAELDKVLINCVVSKFICFALVDSKQVFSNALNVFSLGGMANFGLLQSTIHEVWARKFGSSLRQDSRYNITDCFETFPIIRNEHLELIGDKYYKARDELCTKYKVGLTGFYNMIHDHSCCHSDILDFRNLFVELNNKVVDAYGWSDIQLSHDFLVNPELGSKNNVRFTISQENRKEIITRLELLNKSRHEAEQE